MAVPGDRGGRAWGILVAAPGEKRWPPVGRSSCPLTHRIPGTHRQLHGEGVARLEPSTEVPRHAEVLREAMNGATRRF